jgi:hypothetical protein
MAIKSESQKENLDDALAQVTAPEIKIDEEISRLIMVRPSSPLVDGRITDMVEPFERIHIPAGKWTPVPETDWVVSQLKARLLKRK